MRGLPALLPVLSLALAQTVIPFWHTAGPPGDRVLEEAIRSFNAGQNAYRLEARYVGDYREAGVKLLAALRSGRPPALFHAARARAHTHNTTQHTRNTHTHTL